MWNKSRVSRVFEGFWDVVGINSFLLDEFF